MPGNSPLATIVRQVGVQRKAIDMITREISLLDKSFYLTRSGRQATVLEMRCTLTQAVNPTILNSALAKALGVHVNFRIRPIIADNMVKATIDDVERPPLYEEDGRTRHLGTEDTEGLVFYVTYANTDITLHVFHGLADLRGIYAFLQTLLKFYFHELGLATAELPEPNSIDTMPFYEHIMQAGAPGMPEGLYNPNEHEIFSLPVESFGKETTL